MKSLRVFSTILLPLVAGNPLPPSSSTADGGDVCTRVMFIEPSFAANAVKTVYTTTSTTTSTVDCGSCTGLQTTTLPPLVLGVPPVAFITSTTTASEPSVTVEHVCSSKTASRVARGENEEGGRDARPRTVTALPPGIRDPECTITTQVDPEVPDSTSTVYTAGTTTAVSEVDCGECAMVWSTGVLYFFAPVVNTATTTAEDQSTLAELACAKPT